MFTKFNKALNDRRAGLQREEGFTLIELLVVVIIIGILAAIAIPVYLGIQNNAKDSAVKADVSRLKTAVVAYQTDNNGDIPTVAELTAAPAYGYNGVDATNYGTEPTLTAATDDSAFCVAAVSVTGTALGASDNSGVAEGTCSTAGVFTPTP